MTATLSEARVGLEELHELAFTLVGAVPDEDRQLVVEALTTGLAIGQCIAQVEVLEYLVKDLVATGIGGRLLKSIEQARKDMDGKLYAHAGLSRTKLPSEGGG